MHVASMDEIYVTYVDDEHVDNHDYDDDTDDDNDYKKNQEPKPRTKSQKPIQ